MNQHQLYDYRHRFLKRQRRLAWLRNNEEELYFVSLIALSIIIYILVAAGV